MTPLLGTNISSTPVGDVPAGDNKTARAQGRQGFHETRDKAIAWSAAQASANSEVFTKHETRDTNHGFFSNHGLYRRARRPLTTSRRILTGPFLDVLGLLPQENGFCRLITGFYRLITTFYRIITGQNPTIPRNSSEFVGIRRIAIEPLSARRPHPHSPPSHSFPVHDGSPLFTIVRHCSSKNIALGQCRLSVRTGNTACLVFTKHETRDTNHGLCCGAAWAAMARHGRHIAPRQRACPVSRSRSASRRAPLAGLLPVPRTPNEPMPERGTFCIASTVRSRLIDTSSIAVIPLRFSFRASARRCLFEQASGPAQDGRRQEA